MVQTTYVHEIHKVLAKLPVTSHRVRNKRAAHYIYLVVWTHPSQPMWLPYTSFDAATQSWIHAHLSTVPIVYYRHVLPTTCQKCPLECTCSKPLTRTRES